MFNSTFNLSKRLNGIYVGACMKHKPMVTMMTARYLFIIFIESSYKATPKLAKIG